MIEIIVGTMPTGLAANPARFPTMNTIHLAYIIGAPVITGVFCAAVPRWSFHGSDAGTGLLLVFLSFCWLAGGAIGYFIPQWLAMQFGDGTLDALGRVAQIIGVPCGLIIAFRGTLLFATLGLLAVGVAGVYSLGAWVING